MDLEGQRGGIWDVPSLCDFALQPKSDFFSPHSTETALAKFTIQ